MPLPVEILGPGPVVRPLPGSDCDYQLCGSIAQLREYLRPAYVDRTSFGADWEASSLNTLVARPAGLSVSMGPKSGLYVPVGHIVGSQANLPANEVLQALQDADAAGAESIWFNVAYDHELMEQVFGWVPTYWQDTLIGVNLVDANVRELGLKASALRFLGEKMYEIKDLDEEWVKLSKVQQKQQRFKLPHELPPQDVTVYACADADMGRRIWFHPQVQHAVADQSMVLKIEKDVSVCLREGNRHGVYLDRERLEQLHAQAGQLLDQLRVVIWEALGCELALSKKGQLAQKLLDMGVPVTERTKGGKPTVSVKVLDKYRAHHPVPLLIQYAQLEAQKDNYLAKLIKAHDYFTTLAWSQGRVRFAFNHLGVPTGRMKCGGGGKGATSYLKGVVDVNAQAIPDHEKAVYLPNIRSGFVAPPDFVTVAIDFSQIEVRIVANLSREQKWIETYKDPDGDIHLTNARAIAAVREPGVVVTKDDKKRRGAAKAPTFALLYGGDEHTIARNAGISLTEAKAILDAFFVGLPMVKAWIEGQGTYAEAHKEVRTFTRRLRKLDEYFPNPGAHNLDRKKLFSLNARGKREGINSPVQGSAADIFKMACIFVRREVLRRGWGLDVVSPVVLWIHDELVFYCHKDWVTTVVPAVCRVMEFGIKNWLVPLKVDPEVGSRRLYLEHKIVAVEKDGQDASAYRAQLAEVTEEFGRCSTWGELVPYADWVARYAPPVVTP